jgi:hypothetical protein
MFMYEMKCIHLVSPLGGDWTDKRTTGLHARRKPGPRCSQPPLGGMTIQMFIHFLRISNATLTRAAPVIVRLLKVYPNCQRVNTLLKATFERSAEKSHPVTFFMQCHKEPLTAGL